VNGEADPRWPRKQGGGRVGVKGEPEKDELNAARSRAEGDLRGWNAQGGETAFRAGRKKGTPRKRKNA